MKIQEAVPAAQFAVICERMNDFARILRDSPKFSNVRTGADIRFYQQGWRLEKWIEAQLSAREGLSAAWWLDIGPYNDRWIIESHLAIDPDILCISLEDRFATSAEEVSEQLSIALETLKRAHTENREFADELGRS